MFPEKSFTSSKKCGYSAVSFQFSAILRFCSDIYRIWPKIMKPDQVNNDRKISLSWTFKLNKSIYKESTF